MSQGPPTLVQFHRKCGDRVTLLNNDTTAIRNFIEFNHGLILSAKPLTDDILFEVCVDRKVNVWDGSLEIGVTTLDPDNVDLPSTGNRLRNTAWMLSGTSILKDGVPVVRGYGSRNTILHEGDSLGVMRTSCAELMFFLNGSCIGVAIRDMPEKLFAVVDLYGQCVQVSIKNSGFVKPVPNNPADMGALVPSNEGNLTEFEMQEIVNHCFNKRAAGRNLIPTVSENACALETHACLRFHSRCGILVKLSSNNKSAERARPLDDYNNGVVMTHRPLLDNELFEIRIDKLVDKWSGSIEVGVTTHNPDSIRFPSTMTNMDSGTIMMSGCKVLINGQGTCAEYGNFNLDELREGDTVGMMRKSNGELHYFINGFNMGVASDKVDPQVWGVIDLYGMTVKVSILDSCDNMQVINNMQHITVPERLPEPVTQGPERERIDGDTLLFHTLRDSNVIIINDDKTAHRPNAFELYNNAIVMTNRTLRTDELFQVRLDLVITKWAGSIEIGVTQLSCNEIKFPFKLSSQHSSTWAMSGEDVTWDGLVIVPQYVRNLNRLREGDTVGVMRKDLGILHFFVNGEDQGPAAFNVPEHVFGILDLYGRAAQATIVDAYVSPNSRSPETPLSTLSNATIYPFRDLCFHRVHGRNARLSRTRLTASRATVNSEFNDAVLFSSRPLRECEMFEIRIDKMIDCWIGSLEIGVTSIKPEQLETREGVSTVAGTATDLQWDTYILSGSAVIKNGECVRSWYPLDLDTLSIGSRVGMMWHSDGNLHYYLDGMDQGKAWYVPHLNIYAVVDLYGQCTQVTILQNEERQFVYNGCPILESPYHGNPRNFLSPPVPYCFSEYCGGNTSMSHDYSQARRITPSDPTGALAFSSGMLTANEMFEIRIADYSNEFAGGLRMGVTDINILNAHVNSFLPHSIYLLPHFTAFVDGGRLHYTQPGGLKKKTVSIMSSIHWAKPGDKIGMKKTRDGRVLIFINSEQLKVAIKNVPDKVYVVMELYGKNNKIHAIAKQQHHIGSVIPQPFPPILSQIASSTQTLVPGPTSLAIPTTQSLTSSVANSGADTILPVPVTTSSTVTSTAAPPRPIPTLTAMAAAVAASAVVAPVSDKPGETITAMAAIIAASAVVQRPVRVEPVKAPPVTAPLVATQPVAAPLVATQPVAAPAITAITVTAPAVTAPPVTKPTVTALPVTSPTPPAAPVTKPPVMALPVTAAPVTKPPVMALPVTAPPVTAPPVAAPPVMKPPVMTLPIKETTVPVSVAASAVTVTATEPCVVTSLTEETKKHRTPLPYTFHYVHGGNIKLCSSDTVAMRTSSYKDGIAIISQPLRRGNKFRFRIDKVRDEWSGTVSVGAVGALPPESVPTSVLALKAPAWVLSSEVLCDNGTVTLSPMGAALEDITELSVVSLYFRGNSELVLELDGRTLGVIAVVPRAHHAIYPLIDLYGKVSQVSALLHPYIVTSGGSLDLPLILENHREEPVVEQQESGEEVAEARCQRRRRALSQDDVHKSPQGTEPGPSRDTPPPSPVIDEEPQPPSPTKVTLHQSLLVEEARCVQLDTNDELNQNIQKSQSIHSFLVETNERALPGFMAWQQAMHSARSLPTRTPHREHLVDTNIRENDQFPEVNAVDNNGDARSSESYDNLPDLTVEHPTTSAEEVYTWTYDHPGYFRSLMSCLENFENPLEVDREAIDQCEHLHLVLKFFDSVFASRPEMGRALLKWGRLYCFCHNCVPDVDGLTGWVYVREWGVQTYEQPHMFWHMDREMLVTAISEEPDADLGTITRPSNLTKEARENVPFVDVWLDEEGKPHQAICAVEMRLGEEPKDDALVSFLIYLQCLQFEEDPDPEDLSGLFYEEGGEGRSEAGGFM